jgi:hypothetical protein
MDVGGASGASTPHFGYLATRVPKHYFTFHQRGDDSMQGTITRNYSVLYVVKMISKTKCNFNLYSNLEKFQK